MIYCHYIPSLVKLGCLPSRRDRRTLKIAKYAASLQLPPETVRWDQCKNPMEWGDDGNNHYGNCVIVTAAHIIDCAEANESGQTSRIEDQAVVNLSREMGALHGFNILDRLNYWRKQGMWGHKLTAFAEVSDDHELLRFCIDAFGCVEIAVSLPTAWRGSEMWETGKGYKYAPGTWGGHSVPILGYDAKWLFVCTWGGILPMSYAAYDEYVSERYTVLMPEWFAKDDLTPSGLDQKALLADLEAITGDPVFVTPPIDPIGPPPGPPPA